jgi:hypothetical protein
MVRPSQFQLVFSIFCATKDSVFGHQSPKDRYPGPPPPMMNTLAADSVRIHNEGLHGGFTHFLQYAIPVLIVFVFLWAKFVKS